MNVALCETSCGASVMLCDAEGAAPVIRIALDDGVNTPAVLLLEVAEAINLEKMLARALARVGKQ